MVSEPTHKNNILDLFLTSSPTLVDSVSVVPGISDHEAVFAFLKLGPTVKNLEQCS